MAAGSPGQRLREEARCPVCLDFLQDPVSVDCGHSFCVSCISEFCDRSDREQGGLFACPQCRSPFTREGFRPNRQLASLVDSVRRLEPDERPSWAQCALHGQELSRFCEEDQVALCWACYSGPEHRGHHTAPLEEAAQRHQVSCSLGRTGRLTGLEEPSDHSRPSRGACDLPETRSGDTKDFAPAAPTPARPCPSPPLFSHSACP